MDKGRGGSQKEPTGVEQRVAEKQSTGQGPLPRAVGMCKPSSLKIAEWGKRRVEPLKGPLGSVNFKLPMAATTVRLPFPNLNAAMLALLSPHTQMPLEYMSITGT